MDKTAISTELEKLEDSSAKVTVTVSAEDVNKRISAQYHEAATKYKISGFRPGKAPRSVLDARVGKQSILADATDKLLNETYYYALDTCNLNTLGDPRFEADKLVEDNTPYVYSMTAKLVPEFELLSYEPVEVEVPAEEVSDKEVDDQIEMLRSYQYTFEEVTGREVQERDYLILAIDATSDGEKVERLCNDERIYQLGNGILPKAFDDQLLGMKPGDNKKFTLSPDEGVDGKAVDFDVTVKKIREKVYAEIDDEFAKKCGVDTLEELRQRLSDSIKEEKGKAIPRIKENNCSYAIAERLSGEAPKVMVNSMRQELLQQFYNNLQNSGISFDMYLAQRGMKREDFMADIAKQALDITNQALALDAIARHQGFTITDEDLDAEFAKSGADDPAQLRAEWEENGRMTSLRTAMLRTKASEWVMDTAIVKSLTAEEIAEKNKKAAEEAAAKKAAEAAEADAKKDEAEDSEKKPAKKTSKKAAAKAEEPAAEAAAETAAEAEKPAKKASTKKAAAKKATDDDASKAAE